MASNVTIYFAQSAVVQGPEPYVLKVTQRLLFTSGWLHIEEKQNGEWVDRFSYPADKIQAVDHASS